MGAWGKKKKKNIQDVFENSACMRSWGQWFFSVNACDNHTRMQIKQYLNTKQKLMRYIFNFWNLISSSWYRVYTKLFATSLLLTDGRITWKPENMMEKLDQCRILLPADSKNSCSILLFSPLLGVLENTNIFIYS